MDKAPDAYRTISEVAEDLDIAQHVLRFWETRFPQIKPLKRGGGRRYYRPDDVELLKGIRHLLYKEGYTIKGVQRILKDQGARAVQAFGRPAEPLAWPGPPESEAPMPSAASDEPSPPSIEAPPVAARLVAPLPAQVEPARPLPAPLVVAETPNLPAVRPAIPANPSQVASFRGGLQKVQAAHKAVDSQRDDEAALPLLSGLALPALPERSPETVVPAAGLAAGAPAPPPARTERLRLALGEIEACRAAVAATLAARPR